MHIGTASGHLLDIHTKVKMYLAPPFPFGSGPTRSTATLSNGSESIGVSIILAVLLPALLIFKQTSQDLTSHLRVCLTQAR